MISREVIQKILEAGAQAPSGSNSQPWRFEVAGGTISIIMLPEKDHPILNFRNRGTLLAHRALIENIVIAAAHYKLKSEKRMVFLPCFSRSSTSHQRLLIFFL